MEGYFSLLTFMFCTVSCYSTANECGNEQTYSKFKYDKQMLEAMVRMEAKMNQWEKERQTFEESMLSVMEHRKEEMKQHFIEQNEKMQELIDDYENIRDKTSGLEKKAANFSSTPKIAFNAYTMSSKNYDVGQTVMFPLVLLNEGGGYEKNTGIFTAPVAGLYHFSFHLCHEVGTYMVAALVYGDTVVAATMEFASSGASCSSVTAPLKMMEGERVFVKCTFKSAMRADSAHRWPSFTGALLNI